MKKKIRHITVDEHKYNWLVTRIDSDNALLRIWLADSKKVLFIQATFIQTDFWLNFTDITKQNSASNSFVTDMTWQDITPKTVATIIKTVIKDKGLASHIVEPISLDWCLKNS